MADQPAVGDHIASVSFRLFFSILSKSTTFLV
jgi:hypothetical protein